MNWLQGNTAFNPLYRMKQIAFYLSFALFLTIQVHAGDPVLPSPDDPPWLSTGEFNWNCSLPLSINGLLEKGELALKDPTLVQFGDRWHVFTSLITYNKNTRYVSLKHISFKEWDKLDQARSSNIIFPGNIGGSAPQVFYFTPHKKWYLIYQASADWENEGITPTVANRAPVFSTNENIDDPMAWTRAERLDMEIEGDRLIPKWIDFWVICDDSRAHLFFTSDDGYFWHSTTSISAFPQGWSKPEVALRETQLRLFEASCTYKLKGINKYLTIIEAVDIDNIRFYKAWLANNLDGPWEPLAGSKVHPFAHVSKNVHQEEEWTRSISHGELIRSGYDEHMEIDPNHLRFLFQGVTNEGESNASGYHDIPWKLGIIDLTDPL